MPRSVNFAQVCGPRDLTWLGICLTLTLQQKWTMVTKRFVTTCPYFVTKRHMVTKPHSLAKPHHRMSRWQKIFVTDKNMIGDEIFSSPIRIIGDKTFSSPNILRHQTNDFSFVIFFIWPYKVTKYFVTNCYLPLH